MEMKHTPGPWTFDSEFTFDIQCGDGLYPFSSRRSIEERKANARLIAAAPTMYQYILDKANSGDKEAQSILESIHV